MEKANFRFHTGVRVRNYEVDWQGIVHNANYLLYFEVARIEYLQRMGVPVTIDTIQEGSRVVLARNEINYVTPARFDDRLDVYARIAAIKNTSFVFEGLIERAGTGELIAENVAVHVWLDAATGEPTRVSREFREIIRQFEGNGVLILDPPAGA